MAHEPALSVKYSLISIDIGGIAELAIATNVGYNAIRKGMIEGHKRIAESLLCLPAHRFSITMNGLMFRR